MEVEAFFTRDYERESWKLIRYFKDASYCANAIKHIHDIRDSKHDKNIKKQCNQADCCIRQSEDYFISSKNVTLTTKPLLVYYGIVSLSQLIYLIKGTGDYSFDQQRKSRGNNNHGLFQIFSDLAQNIKSSKVIDILHHLKSDVNKNSKGISIGQFKLFYNCLTEPAVQTRIKITNSKDVYFISKELAVNPVVA